MTDLRDLFELYVYELADSGEHKRHLLTSDACFVEWVEEHHATRIGELS